MKIGLLVLLFACGLALIAVGCGPAPPRTEVALGTVICTTLESEQTAENQVRLAHLATWVLGKAVNSSALAADT
jgi:hypothetical protein